jgi:hypothetical protein
MRFAYQTAVCGSTCRCRGKLQMNPVKSRLVIFVMLAVGAARGAAAQYVPIDLGALPPSR